MGRLGGGGVLLGLAIASVDERDIDAASDLEAPANDTDAVVGAPDRSQPDAQNTADPDCK